MLTIAVANAKGGVGKTSTAVHLATGLAKYEDARVLLVDLDPQTNSTTWLLGKIPPNSTGIYEVLTKGAPVKKELRIVEERGISLLPATPRLRNADLELANQMGGQLALKEALAELASDFDYAILDCPPNLGITVSTAICASDYILTPVLPAYFSLDGLDQLEETVALARRRMKDVTAQILGYFLFASNRQEVVTREAFEVLKERAPDKIFHAQIRTSTVARLLPAERRLAWDQGYDPRGRNDYQELLKEFTARIAAAA
jgi:chromosome partitioning protein